MVTTMQILHLSISDENQSLRKELFVKFAKKQAQGEAAIMRVIFVKKWTDLAVVKPYLLGFFI